MVAPFFLQRVFIRVIILFNALVCCLYLAAPTLRSQFVDENMFLENAGAIFFFIAFLLGTVVCSLLPAGTAARKYGWLIPFLGLLGFLDDTSFFGLLEGEETPGRPPTIVGMSRLPQGRYALYVGPYKVDALHDIAAIAMKAVRDTGSMAVYTAVAIFIGATAGLAFACRRRYMPAIMNVCRRYPAFDYLRVAIICLVGAIVLDFNIIQGDLGHLLSELLEANAAICLVFSAAALSSVEDSNAQP